MRIDGLQYANWSEKVFRQMRSGGLSAVHVTVAYHEGFRETVTNLEDWNRRFERFPEFICKGQWAADIDCARKSGRTAIFFGAQNSSPIESDIGLIEILHTLGLRFMQLTYNNQSLLASGCYEAEDGGITRMGRQAIKEMNRVGLVIDMSHSGPRSTIEAADLSQRPITISHANPLEWSPSLRNKNDDVIRAVTGNGGIMGFSIYPHHLRDGSSCTLDSFSEMIARAVEKFGIEHFGIGSDLCQDQPDSVVTWMRTGRWTRDIDYGEGSASAPGFPPMPEWFRDNRDFANIESGLRSTGMNDDEIGAVLGGNWYRFFDESFRSVT
ncbi:MAG: membrane dipeptidase [Rhodobacteraceae bacterium]|nr:membrane dipeptidase [Paracoccaceae bacterium]MCY4137742.1 membrane dipeptidase [Paracoccaceae bacterium]